MTRGSVMREIVADAEHPVRMNPVASGQSGRDADIAGCR